MAIEIASWEVTTHGGIQPLNPVISEGKEKELQDLLLNAPGILEEGLIIVGYEYHGIDLLGMDAEGRAVIIETKSEGKRREAIAQLIEYASELDQKEPDDVKKEIEENLRKLYPEEEPPFKIGNKVEAKWRDSNFYRGKIKEIDEKSKKYYIVYDDGNEGWSDEVRKLDIIGEVRRRVKGDYTHFIINPRLMVVAPSLSPTYQRMVEYLRGYGIDISWTILQVVEPVKGKRIIHKVGFAPEEKRPTPSLPRRPPNLTYAELEGIADSQGVGELYKHLVKGLTPCFDSRSTTRSSIAFIGIIEGSRDTIFSILPGESNPKDGLCYQAYIGRLSKYFGVEEKEIIDVLPPGFNEPPTTGERKIEGYFKDKKEADNFINELREWRQKAGHV